MPSSKAPREPGGSRRDDRSTGRLGGVTNGALLDRISGQFDVFITTDGNLTAQQSPQFLAGRSFGVVILRAPSNRLEALQPLVPDLLEALAAIRPGEVALVASGEA